MYKYLIVFLGPACCRLFRTEF